MFRGEPQSSHVKHYRVMIRDGVEKIQEYREPFSRNPGYSRGNYINTDRVPQHVLDKIAVLDIKLATLADLHERIVTIPGVGQVHAARPWRGHEPTRYYKIIFRKGDSYV